MHESFFSHDLADLLKPLRSSTPRTFGQMTAEEMLEHLMSSLELTYGKLDIEFQIPEDKFDKARAFLHSERQIRPGAQKPVEYNTIEEEVHSPSDLDAKKIELVNRAQEFLLFIEEHPAIKTAHPYFGWLQAEDWKAFQRKHFEHHFRQFGLLDK